jgi:hypothetical protein
VSAEKREYVIVCPRCEHEMTDDEMHSARYAPGSDDADLWGIAPNEERVKIVCPSVMCRKPFYVQGGYVPTYTTATNEEDL